MNHRTRTDWNFMWPTVYHCVIGSGRYKHPTKFVLKDIIRHIPGPGKSKDICPNLIYFVVPVKFSNTTFFLYLYQIRFLTVYVDILYF